jgi:hypothetical protein
VTASGNEVLRDEISDNLVVQVGAVAVGVETHTASRPTAEFGETSANVHEIHAVLLGHSHSGFVH